MIKNKNIKKVKYASIGFFLILLNLIIIITFINSSKISKIENILNSQLNKDIILSDDFKAHISTKELVKCENLYFEDILNFNSNIECKIKDGDVILLSNLNQNLQKINSKDNTLVMKTKLFDFNLKDIIRGNNNFELTMYPLLDNKTEIFKNIKLKFSIDSDKLFKNETLYNLNVNLENDFIKIDQTLKLLYVLNNKPKEYFIFEKDNKFFDSDFVMTFIDEYRVLENSGSLNSYNNEKIIDTFYNMYSEYFNTLDQSNKRIFNINYLNYESYELVKKDFAKEQMLKLLKIAKEEYAYSDKALYVNFLYAIFNNENKVYTSTKVKNIDLALPYSYIYELSAKNPEKAYEETRKRYNYIIK